MERLKGKVAIITGAALSIGHTAACKFAEEGAKVIAVDLNEAGLQRLEKDAANAGGEVTCIVGDVTKRETAEKAVATAVEKYGRLDVLYNNVGGPSRKDTSFLELTEDIWDWTVKLNVTSTIFFCQEAVRQMQKNGGGSIIVTVAGAAYNGSSWITGYGISKGSLPVLTKYIATQHGKDRIRCNNIVPGMIVTEVSEENLSEEQKEQFLEVNMLPFNGKPIDITNAALYLASDESKFVSGTTILVDGGAMSGKKM